MKLREEVEEGGCWIWKKVPPAESSGWDEVYGVG
jgi:hypothetical protein